MEPRKSQKITVYWLDGSKEVIEGLSVGNSFQTSGIPISAIKDIVFIANGDDDSWTWIDGHWVKKAQS